MTKDIEFFSPKALPFGPLSNDYHFWMNIDNESWPTVTHYIYSNLICAPYNINLKSARNPIEVRKMFHNLYQTCTNHTIAMAARIALKVKFANPVLEDALLQTGNRQIILQSDNPILGISADGVGQNLYGKDLQQLRHELRLRQREQAEKEQKFLAEETMVLIFRAYMTLLNAIRKKYG